MKLSWLLPLLLLVASLAACGGGGSTTTGASPVTTQGNVVITGTAANGLIQGGTVKIYLMGENGSRVLLTSTTTDTNGRYAATITSQTGPVLVEVTGGTYLDEATGVTVPVTTPVRAAIASASSTTAQVAVTSLTELAVRLAGTNPTATSIARGNVLVTDLFNFDIIATQPVEPTAAGFMSTSTAQKDYTLALAGLSQQAKDTTGGTIDGVVESLRNEIAAAGRLSAATAANLKTEVAAFLSSSRNQTGITSITTGLAGIGSMTFPVKLTVGGTFASGSFIKGLQMKVVLPPGVTVPTDGSSVPISGAIAFSGSANTDSTKGSAYDASTRTLSLAIVNLDPGFGLGDVVTINCDVAPGSTLSSTGFSITDVVAVGSGGMEISGLTLTLIL